jgi:hypothetical protein
LFTLSDQPVAPHGEDGKRAAAQIQLRSYARRVTMKARVVRHRGTRFHSALLPKHTAYLKRDA